MPDRRDDDTGSTVNTTLEFGLDTFGDVTNGPDARPRSYAQVIRDVVEQAVLADQLGVNFLGVGEHHRDEFAVTSPKWSWPSLPPGRRTTASGLRSR